MNYFVISYVFYFNQKAIEVDSSGDAQTLSIESRAHGEGKSAQTLSIGALAHGEGTSAQALSIESCAHGEGTSAQALSSDENPLSIVNLLKINICENSDLILIVFLE